MALNTLDCSFFISTKINLHFINLRFIILSVNHFYNKNPLRKTINFSNYHNCIDSQKSNLNSLR